MKENAPAKESDRRLVEEQTRSNASSPQRRTQLAWLRKPTPDLAKPFGSLYWPLAIPALFCSLLAMVLFARVLDLGTLTVHWTIQFNVNSIITLVILLAGALAIVPKGLKNPQEWRSRNTVVSIVVLLLVALYFLLGGGRLGPIQGLNFGTFVYSISSLDVNVVCILLLAVLLLGLALRGSIISGLFLLIIFLWWGFSLEGFNWDTITSLFTSETGGSLLRSMIPPDWTYFSRVTIPMLITIQTAVVATVIGIVGALPLSILAARNTTPHPVIYNVVRLLVNTLRSVPSLVLALIFITFIGLGPVPGAFGLGLHTISVLTKLYAEAIESVKPQPIEALSAAGANGLQRFRWGVFPQAFPLLVSSSIYYWEANTRDSTVVAFVGGGGIGFLLNQNLSLLAYENVSVILVTLVVTVALLDRVSDFVRAKVL